MTPEEFQYIKRAVEALEQPPHLVTRAKILRTISQITARAADQYEREFQDRVEQTMERNRLVDILNK